MKSRRTGEEIVINDANLKYVFDGRNGESGFCLDWDSNIGFGQLTFIKDVDNGCCKYYVETETMCDNTDKEFIKLVLDKFIDKLDVIE